MKKEIKEKWIKALRSGKYKQGRGTLCSTKNQYCCLGVLAEITGHLVKEKGKRGVVKAEDEEELHRDDLPDFLLRKFRLSEENQQLLIYLNDQKRLSFKEIADTIENPRKTPKVREMADEEDLTYPRSF